MRYIRPGIEVRGSLRHIARGAKRRGLYDLYKLPMTEMRGRIYSHIHRILTMLYRIYAIDVWVDG